MANAYTISDFRKDIRQPYAFPGGYAKYFITSDGGAMSMDAAKKNIRNILESMKDGVNDGFWIIAVDVNWENPDLYCDHTSKRIPSEYAEKD